MSTNTEIPYCDATWDVVEGCSKVSPGCARCWSERLSHRWGWTSKPWTPENAAENVVLRPDRLDEPMRWRKPKRVFVCSRSDWFHEQVPDEFIDRVFATMGICGAQRQTCQNPKCEHDEDVNKRGCWMRGEGREHPIHQFLVLTKRPARMREYLVDEDCHARILSAGNDADWSIAWEEPHDMLHDVGWPLPNVWLGVSVENQHWADERIPLLLDTPAAVRWVSAEPLIAPLNIEPWIPLNEHSTFRAARGAVHWAQLPRLDWLVLGGESGPGFRPMQLDWVQSLSEQCRAADVAYYGKQQAARRQGVLLPGDLGRRQFPR